MLIFEVEGLFSVFIFVAASALDGWIPVPPLLSDHGALPGGQGYWLSSLIVLKIKDK